jgi:hypothetical protein
MTPQFGNLSKLCKLRCRAQKEKNSMILTSYFCYLLISSFLSGGILGEFHRAGKLIPRLIDPWLELNGVFGHGLSVDKLITIDEPELEDDTEVME